MGECFFNSQPSLRATLQHSYDKVSRLRSQLAGHSVYGWLCLETISEPQLRHFLKCRSPRWKPTHLDNPVHLIDIGSTAEYLLTIVQLHHQSPNREHINLHIVRQPQHQLQRTIPPCHHILGMSLPRPIVTSKPKINEFGLQGDRVNQYIFGFDVPVHDAHPMHVTQPFDHLVGDEGYLIVGEAAAPILSGVLVKSNEIAGHELEYEVGVGAVSQDVEQADYIGMLQFLQDEDFPLHDHFDLGGSMVDLFDGHLGLGEGVGGADDHAVGALSDLLFHPEPLHRFCLFILINKGLTLGVGSII